MSEDKLNLIQKLIEIRKRITYLKKDSKGNQGANYVSPEVILGNVRPLMDEYNVLLVTDVVSSDISKMPNPTKAQPEHYDFVATLNLNMIWINGDNPEDKLSVGWLATGSHRTDPSMAEGGALTYSTRYFFMNEFNIPTGNDDPEKYVEKLDGQKKASKKELENLRKELKKKNIPESDVLYNYSDNDYTMTNLAELTKNQCKEAVNIAKNAKTR
jgi:hypothetical protein